MHDNPRQRLRELIQRHGPALCDDPRRCEALLRDFCGEQRRELFALVSALREQVVSDLRSAGREQPMSAVVARLGRRLHEQLGLVEESARWAVESWALALGLATEDELATSEARRAGWRQPPEVQQSVVVAAVGSADFRSLAEAIDKVPPHTQVRVRPGLYREGFTLRKPIEIVGDGAAGEVVIESDQSAALRLIESEARVAGLTLAVRAGGAGKRYAAVEVDRGRLLLEDCDLSSAALSCVLVRGNDAHASLRRCQLHHGKECGLFVLDGAEAQLDDCALFRNGLSGVDVRQATVHLRRCRIYDQPAHAGVTLADNAHGTLEECEVFGNTLAGVVISAGARAQLRRVQVHHGKDAGIRLQARGQATLEDCDVYAHAGPGLVIHESTAVLRRCSVHDQPAHHGVLVAQRGQARCEECEVYANGQAGIGIEDSQVTLRACTIHHQAGHNGVQLGARARGELDDCTIRGNGYAGLEVNGGSEAVLKSCRLTGNGTYGVRLIAQSSVQADGCDLTDNAISAWSVDPDCRHISRDSTL